MGREGGSVSVEKFGEYGIIKPRIGDGTHHKKRHSRKAHQDKGATPIEKNVIVVDEQGNEYEATYPKRAKGLVKNGRARFLDEHTICLACPPDQMNLEDKTMSEQIVPEKLSMNYILEQIEKITNQTDYIYSVIEKLEQVQSKGPGDVAGEA